MTDLAERVKQLEKDAATGMLGSASKADLEKYLAVLCEPNAGREFSDRQFPVISETIRTLLLRAHIESLQSHVVRLHDHITKLNTKNTITQYCVIALTVAAVTAASIQTTVAIRAERRAEAQDMQSAKAPQTQQSPALAPTPATPPANHPAASRATGEKTAKEKSRS